MLSVRFLTAATMIGAITLPFFTSNADAQQYRKSQRGGSITVESDYGNGTVTGRVRYRNGGAEVQLPGGTWVSCFAGCDYALRTESVDFWEKQREEQGGGRGWR